MKILVCDNYSPQARQLLEEAPHIEVAYRTHLTSSQLLTEIADAEALLIRAGTEVTAEVIAAAKQLKVIARAGISIENVDIEAATRRGIVVMNTPYGSTTTIAEHSIAMLLTLARCIPQAHNSVQAGHWHMSGLVGVDITNKTLGILGGGKISRRVVERGLGLQMQVLVYDPYLNPDVIRRLGAEPVDFPQLLKRSDFLSMHLPLNDETWHILDSQALEQVKPGVRIINCALGGLIDEQALSAAIENGRVAGAALDVLEEEPPPVDHPLMGHERVIITPHLRAETEDARTNLTVQACQQVLDYLQQGSINNALNMPNVSRQLLRELQPALQLGEGMGRFLVQLIAKPLQRIRIEYFGSLLEWPTETITISILKGVLDHLAGSMVNFVNAPHLARERGIEVLETRQPSTTGFSNQIRLTFTTADGSEHYIAGAIFSPQDYRIVEVDHYDVETVPHGTVLVVYNNDQPGVIAHIGSTLANANINIAMLDLSRCKIQGQAISILTVDQPISASVLDQLRTNPNIHSVKQVELQPLP